MTRELLALPRVAGKDRAAARVTSGACAHAVLRGPMGRWSARVQGSRPSRTDADTRRVARVRADGQGVVSYIPHPHRTYKDGCIECTRVERVSYLCRANVSLMPTHAVVRRDVSAFPEESCLRQFKCGDCRCVECRLSCVFTLSVPLVEIAH